VKSLIIKRKLFLNFEKEERWINEMSKQGLQLKEYKFGRYFFEKGKPNEYIYRIEMLDENPKSEKSQEYIRFMEESGVEFVGSYNTWVYFRKKVEDGPFEIYTDYLSRIQHYEKIARMFGIIALINIAIFFVNFSMGLSRVSEMNKFVAYISIINVFAAILLFIPYMQLTRQIQKLKKEKDVFDR
jgi:hypothetical protein